MGILTKIHEIGLASSGLRTIHETGKYFKKSVANTTGENSVIYDVEHSFKGPTKAVVNQAVMFYGTAPYGYVNVYSGGKKEKTAVVISGKYYCNLYFSKPGTYEMYSIWLEKYKSDIIMVEVSSCNGCGK